MNKYKVTIVLKNGNVMKGIYETAKTNVLEIAKEMLPECKPNNIFGFKSEDANEVVFIVTSEIAAFKIGV